MVWTTKYSLQWTSPTNFPSTTRQMQITLWKIKKHFSTIQHQSKIIPFITLYHTTNTLLIQGNQRNTWVYEEYPMSKAEGMDRDEIFQIHIAICKIYLIQRLEQTLGTISINTEITLE